MFRVVACGFAAAAVPSLPAGAVAQLPHPSEPGFLETALDHLLTDDSGRARLLLHDGTAASEHRIRLLRRVYGDHRVLPVGVRRPLTGLAATATVLAGLAELGLAPGAVISSMPLVVGHSRVDAVSRRVSGLDFPEVRMRHQLLSMIPGAMVRLRFTDQVEVGAPRSAPEAGPEHGADAVILRAGDPALSNRLPAIHQLEAQADTVDVDGAVPLTTGWWGTSHYYERCVLPTDLRELGFRIMTGPWRHCPECGESVRSHCRFCSAQEAYA